MKKMLNMRELMEALSNQIIQLQNDETTPGKANAVTNACGKMLSCVKVQMEYHKSIGKSQKILFLEDKA